MKTVFLSADDRTVDLGLHGEAFAATIGFFDGLHRGHQFLLQQLRELAGERGLKTMAVTFSHHPRQVVQQGWQPQLLTSLEEKAELMAQTGLDTLVVLRFDRAMAQVSARQFMAQVLGRQLGVRLLLTGYDNRFGHDRSEGFSDYVGYGRALGIEVMAANAFELADGQAPSSSAIRQLLSEGRVAEATALLGHPYKLQGTIVHGEQIGRQMGFPTANLQLSEPLKLVPCRGVYAVTAHLEGCDQPGLGMTNIGHRPTFGGQQLTVETHLLDFTGQIYNKHFQIAFHSRLRDEQHFSSPEALKAQMLRDADEARKRLTSL